MVKRSAVRLLNVLAILPAITSCQANSAADALAEPQDRASSVLGTDVPTGPPNYDALRNPFEIETNWAAFQGDRGWGQVSAIGIDADGQHVWVADRCGSACIGTDVSVVLRLAPSGEVVTGFGSSMFVRPYGMHIDSDGNIWVTDVREPRADELEQYPEARERGHAVYKFSPEGELLLTLGTPGTAGDPPSHLTQPNDVVTAANGDIFVAEGHSSGNPPGRISRFSSDGSFIASWGEFGSGPGQFRTPHGMAFDSRGRLFVADRGNSRIQIFEPDGTYIATWTQFGRPNDVLIDENDVLYAADSESGDERNPRFRRGIYIGNAVTGQVTGYVPPHEMDRVRFSERDDVSLGTVPEGIALDAQGNLYGAEVVLYGITRYVRQ